MSESREARKHRRGQLPDKAPSGNLLSELTPDGMTEWERLPDIGLYMDQVLTLVERQLAVYRHDPTDRIVTAAMVNNYIKDGLVPRAESKKYAPAHLALLLMIGTLKQVLSIPDIKRMISPCQDVRAVEQLYTHFLALQHDAFRDTADLIAQAGLPDSSASTAESKERLRRLALELVVEARTRVLAAQRVLDLMAQLKVESDHPQPKAESPEAAD
jgi:hypothetical protein